MSYIFISYSHKDKAYAHKLHRALMDRGLDAWIDDHINYGSDWPQEIEKRLNDCSVFVLVMSPDSKKSKWVQNELLTARKLNKIIFPLLLGGEVWWQVQDTQAVDVRSGKLPSANFFTSLGSAVVRYKTRAEQIAETAEKPKIETVTIQVGGNLSGNLIVGPDNTIQTRFTNPPETLPASELVTAPEKPLEKPEHELKPTDSAPDEGKHPDLYPKQSQSLRKGNPIIIAIVVAIILLVILFGWFFGGGSRGFALFPFSSATATITVTLVDTPTLTTIPSPTPTLTFTPLPTSTSTITPTPTPFLDRIVDVNGVAMVLIPAGEFTMGNDNGLSPEKPEHRVLLHAYYIDVYEVTNAGYAACVAAGACQPPVSNRSRKVSNYYTDPDLGNFPVVYINWEMAQAYCAWRAGRLPTEAEWEKASRGADQRLYPTGAGVSCTQANYCRDDTTEVGRYKEPPGPYGLFDMAGNVAEWVADWYSAGYYSASLLENPAGPATGQLRVVRGGSFASISNKELQTIARAAQKPDAALDYIGFRCMREP